MNFASPMPLPVRSGASSAPVALRARQAGVLAEIRRFQRIARQGNDSAALHGLVADIVARLCTVFAEEERFLRASAQASYYKHCHAHRRLLAEIANDRRALDEADVLPSGQIAHLFDSYLIHQVTTSDLDIPEVPRNPGNGAGFAFGATIFAETALATPGVRALENMGVAQ